MPIPFKNNNQGFFPQQKPYYNNNQRMNASTQQTKRSGATYTKMRNGKYAGFVCVSAWRVTKQGLLTAKAFPVSDVEHASKDPKNPQYYLRYAVDVVNASVGTKQTFWCLMNVKTQKINISELGLCITPNGSGITKSGKRVTGYFGSNFKRR